MFNSKQGAMVLDFMNEGKTDLLTKPPKVSNEHGQPIGLTTPKEVKDFLTRPLNPPNAGLASLTVPKDVLEDQGSGTYSKHEAKRVKLRESEDVILEKLKGFFELVKQQHPESRLELQRVDGTWKVWCGVCKKLLRTDKSGKAIHNIQRQHFASSRHQKKLHLVLESEKGAGAAAVKQMKAAVERSISSSTAPDKKNG